MSDLLRAARPDRSVDESNFEADVSPETARRQLSLSLVVWVVVLVFAALSLTKTSRERPVALGHRGVAAPTYLAPAPPPAPPPRNARILVG